MIITAVERLQEHLKNAEDALKYYESEHYKKRFDITEQIKNKVIEDQRAEVEDLKKAIKKLS